jgi:hypothetical protein
MQHVESIADGSSPSSLPKTRGVCWSPSRRLDSIAATCCCERRIHGGGAVAAAGLRAHRAQYCPGRAPRSGCASPASP